MRALLGDYSPGSAPAVSVFQKLWSGPFCVPAVPYTSLIQGNSLLPRALLSNCWYEWQQAQVLWTIVCSAGWCSHTVYLLEEICCKKNK